jgi:hypothetical protein
MKCLFILIPLALCLQADSIYGQTNTAHSQRMAAKEGDTIWVLINHVKADKKEQFEKFINEIFWPMAKKLSPAEQRVFKQTRVLYPVTPEPDGTYSYMFIMDPVIPGGNYDIDELLRKMYDPQKAEEYLKMWNDTYVRDQTRYMVVQSRY